MTRKKRKIFLTFTLNKVGEWETEVVIRLLAHSSEKVFDLYKKKEKHFSEQRTDVIKGSSRSTVPADHVALTFAISVKFWVYFIIHNDKIQKTNFFEKFQGVDTPANAWRKFSVNLNQGKVY